MCKQILMMVLYSSLSLTFERFTPKEKILLSELIIANYIKCYVNVK